MLAQALGDQRRLGWVAAYIPTSFGHRRRATRRRGGPARPRPGRALGDAALQVVTRLFLGRAYHALGDYPQAIDLLRQNLVALDGALLRERFGLTRLPSVHVS